MRKNATAALFETLCQHLAAGSLQNYEMPDGTKVLKVLPSLLICVHWNKRLLIYVTTSSNLHNVRW
jgi:hypothetical protein